jgi:hypothetical protein
MNLRKTYNSSNQIRVIVCCSEIDYESKKGNNFTFSTTFISTTLFIEYVLYSTKDEDIRVSYSNVATDISSGVAFLTSLMVIKTTSERTDKSFTYLAIGLGLWFSAELIYTFYQVICGISVPYPTIADFIWIAGYFFLGVYFYKTIKIWHETKRVKLYSIVIFVLPWL